MAAPVRQAGAPDVTVASAVLSDDDLYRYELRRTWSMASAPMTFIMLNPSTADAIQNDPTIRRCIGFAEREGCGGIVVVNLFALRSPKPEHLFDKTIAKDPHGPKNIGYVRRALEEARLSMAPVVCAWGAGTYAGRSHALAHIRGHWNQKNVFYCLGKTKDGSPRHPLFVRAETLLEEWP